MKKDGDINYKHITLLLGLSFLIFITLEIFSKNLEFIFYGSLYFILILLLLVHHKEFNFTLPVLLGLAILLLLHALGSTVKINEVLLYDFWLIDGIYKFDNLVHFLGGFVVLFAIYNWLNPHFQKAFTQRRVLYPSVLILIVCGLGTINEIMELTAVLIFKSTGVGDYFNNSFDLLYNFFGALVAMLLVIHMNKKRNKK